MQTNATTTSPPAPPPGAPVTGAPAEVLGWGGAATPIPDKPKGLAALWADAKVRHGLIVVAGIVVVAVGVVLALLSGGGTPPAEELGASLSQVYSAFHATSPTANSPSATTMPSSTTPAAAATAPVGDVATSASGKSPAPGRNNYGQTEDDDPPASLPAPICPGTSPDCGPFRWDSAPGPNTPQAVPTWTPSVQAGEDSRFHIAVGQVFAVTVTADDPDAEFPSCWITATAAGGTLDAIQCTQEAKVLYPGEYGAHPVPAPVHGTAGPITLSVSYATAGDYDLTFSTTSGVYAQCGMASEVACNPYGDTATVTIPITVG